MHEELQRFFAHPGPRNYLRVRERVLSRRGRRIHSGQLANLVELFVAGRHRELREQIDEMMPAWALSPAVYWLGACAALELDDTAAAELDRFVYQCCLQGIMATGNGGAARPYRITYASDVDEVLNKLGLTRERISLQRGRHGLCDVAHCAGGEQIWFALGEGIRDQWPLEKIPLRIANTLVR
jgi:hypothetical protein